MKNRSILLFLILTAFLHGQYVYGQDQQVTVRILQDSLNILKHKISTIELDNLKIRRDIDSLLTKSSSTGELEEADTDLQQLMDEANQLAEKKAVKDEDQLKKFHSGIRQQQALNPNISLGGDFFAAVSTSDHDFISEPGDISYGNNGLHLRELELALEAPLDPFTRGKSFISISKESISIEEAYMEWLNLPLNMNLKIGVFYSEFGPINRYHDHALPQFDRPRALVNLFSNKGLGGTGFSSNFMLPEILFSDASTFDFAIVRGTETGDNFSFDNKGLLYIGQFKNFYEISQDSYFEFRFSGVAGRNPHPEKNNSYVGSLGINYKWVPAGREKYRTFDWKTELLYSHRLQNSETVKSMGFYSSVQNKLNARFWIGGRIGYSELPYDNTQHEWDYTLNLDFWQSEFVFTRIQYQYNRRNIESLIPDMSNSLPNDHSILLQVCWAMGPHKHEAY